MTKEEAIHEIEKVFEPAFANYIIIALTEGATSSDEEQQPKTGHWITDIYMFGRDRHTCSNCGKGQEYTSAFCSWCGADMREVRENDR